MSKPLLGRTIGGADLAIDLDRLMATRLLLQANSGAGKSWALRCILEQTHGRVQQLVIDVEGEFSTLRERFDYVLAAARGGDCVAEPRSAALLARRLLELGVSAILDIYELKAHEREPFVARFLDAMMNAPKTLWHPVLVVIDEAQSFCPEGGKSESAAAVADLMARGRKRGFCGVLATPRVAQLSKDAAAQASNKMVGRTVLDNDVKRAGDELGLPRADHVRLRALADGHFYAFGPALSDQVVEVHVAACSTTHPKAGARAAPPPAPREKIVQVLAKLTDLPKEAEQEAQDLVGARKRVRELEAEVRRLTAAAPPAPESKIERVEVAVLTPGQLERLEGVASNLRQAANDATSAARDVDAALDRVVKAKTAPPRSIPVLRPAKPNALRAPIQPRPAPDRSARARDVTEANDLTGPEQRVLDALAWWESVGVEAPDKGQVGFIAKYRVGKNVGGTFGNILGALRSRLLIDYPTAGAAALTDAGRAVARAPIDAPTTEALQRAVHDRLDGPESRVLAVLIDAYPEPMTKQECGARADYTVGDNVGGTFGNILGRLRSLGLIDYPRQGMVVALPVLFLER